MSDTFVECLTPRTSKVLSKLVLAVVLVAVCQHAQAVDVISINFQGSAPALSATDTAGALSRSHWNNVAGIPCCAATSGTLSSVLDATGAVIPGVSLTWTATNTYQTGRNDTTSDERMMYGYLDDGGGGPQATISGLTGAYNIYVYANGDGGPGSQLGSYYVGTSAYSTALFPAQRTVTAAFAGTGPYIRSTGAAGSSGHYMVFGNLSLGTVVISANQTGGRSPLVGFQIVPTKLLVRLPGQTYTEGTGLSGTPITQTAGSPFTIAEIRKTDLTGFNTDTTYSGTKTITWSGPGNAPLGGTPPVYTTSVTFVNGVSTTTLSTTLYKAETPIITVTEGANTGSSSALPVVASPAPTQLSFTVSPPLTNVANAIISPSIQVVDQDTYGNTVTSDNSTTITIAFQNNPGGATLSGTKTRTVVNGTATFNDITINNGGTGYTLIATSSPSYTAGVSSAFNVTGADNWANVGNEWNTGTNWVGNAAPATGSPVLFPAVSSAAIK